MHSRRSPVGAASAATRPLVGATSVATAEMRRRRVATDVAPTAWLTTLPLSGPNPTWYFPLGGEKPAAARQGHQEGWPSSRPKEGTCRHLPTQPHHHDRSTSTNLSRSSS